MKFENIKTDSEGLKKIIDFLHSDENILDVQNEARSSDKNKRMLFGLTNATHIMMAGNRPSDNYDITIKSEYGTIPEEHFNKMSDLLKECYVK